MPSPDAPPAIAPAALADAADRAARLLRLMGHGGRLMVFCHLAECEQTVRCLERKLGLRQSALSQHLARLRQGRLVATRRDGQQIHYRLASPEVARILGTLQELYCTTPKVPAVTRP